jgi:protein O-mannosyl-transferase
VNAGTRSPKRQRAGAVSAVLGAVLVALVWAIYGQTLRHEFVEYDDDIYVYDNPQIKAGLTSEAVKWAFTEPHARNWHPLTTLSHIADWQLFGANAGAHHAVNVLLHSLAAVALFLVLRKMTGTLWRSALVAALFAVHPLRVESVAWVAARQDVLSAFLFMLTLGAYERYVRRRSVGRYALVLLVFALGLLAKPILVTLPLVLLLLDRWPLRRFGAAENARISGLMACVVEKLPLLALSAAASAVTFLVQKDGGLQSDAMPLVTRLTNAALACATYIRQLSWPAGLAPFYPQPAGDVARWQIGLAVAALVVITALALIWWRRRPYLAIGWFWFLGMLVPVLAIVQVGPQSWADRYTYLPHVGLLIAGVWGLRELARRWQIRRPFAVAVACLVIVALAVTAWAQTSHWRNTESLWTHTLGVTRDNDVAHIGAGNIHLKRGDLDGALSSYQRALEIRSRRRHSGHDLLLATIHYNLGAVLQRQGRLEEAIDHYSRSVEAQPDYVQANVNLAYALLENRETSRALEMLADAIELEPESAALHIARGDAFLVQGSEARAIESYEQALTLSPDALVPLQNLAWLFATSTRDVIRNGARAVTLAETAVRVSGGNDPLVLRTLSAAHAENGDFAQAVATAERARAAAAGQGNDWLVGELERNISRYRSGMPLRSRVGGG